MHPHAIPQREPAAADRVRTATVPDPGNYMVDKVRRTPTLIMGRFGVESDLFTAVNRHAYGSQPTTQ